MKPIHYILLFSALFISCSLSNKSIRHIRKKPSEITAFKVYLESVHKIDNFSAYDTFWNFEIRDTLRDSFVNNFCKEYSISTISKLPHRPQSSFYDRYGNVLVLYFNTLYFVEGNKIIIFDYTEKGLDVYDPVLNKNKIAKRIYIFK